MSNMMAADTKNDFIDGDETGITMVRLHNSDATGAKIAWPANEIDENATRYVDFAVTAPSTMEVRISGISLEIASHSTSVMCCHVNTGFGDGFTGVKTIDEMKNMPNLQIVSKTYTPMLTIPAGETLHVRILPWHDVKEGSGKYIALRNVKIEGLAFETGLEGMEDVLRTDVPCTKVLRNGQLFIIRDGKTYNALGVELK